MLESEGAGEGKNRGGGRSVCTFSDPLDTLGLAANLLLRVGTKPEALSILPSSLPLAAKPNSASASSTSLSLVDLFSLLKQYVKKI